MSLHGDLVISYQRIKEMHEDKFDPNKICQWCDSSPAIHYHQNTRYVEESRNWVTLCKDCKEENDDHWKELWEMFYSECM